MITNNWARFKKIETIILSVLLYSVLLLYIYQFFKIADKPRSMEQDEVFYYMEAKAISAHNIYHAPISYDGNTSFVGNFGAHGFAYPIKDGWLAKFFFQSQDPPMVWINFLTTLLILALILLFKPFILNTRLKIALIIATHHILYSLTLSYMQETVHFLFAVLALRVLYRLYEDGNTAKNKYLYYYLLIIILAITFRYSWFIWGLGLLPLATNFKNSIKWILVIIGLTAFGIFSFRYFVAPWPYVEGNRVIGDGNLSLLDSINIFRGKFTLNVQLFLTPDSMLISTMRYLFLSLLFISSWFAVVKRKKIVIAFTLIAWAYLFASLAFTFLVNGNDLRLLSSLTPLLAFSLIGTCNLAVFYPIIAIQLLLFPSVVEQRNNEFIALACADSPSEQISRKTSYSKIKDLVTDDDGDNNVVVVLPIQFTYFASYYFINFPLVTNKGIPIHYSVIIGGNGLSKAHPPNYVFAGRLIADGNYKLVYSDRWMYLYRILNNKLPINNY